MSFRGSQARRLRPRQHPGPGPRPQLDALQAAGCGRVFTETASGAQRERPQLQAALDARAHA